MPKRTRKRQRPGASKQRKSKDYIHVLSIQHTPLGPRPSVCPGSTDLCRNLEQIAITKSPLTAVSLSVAPKQAGTGSREMQESTAKNIVKNNNPCSQVGYIVTQKMYRERLVEQEHEYRPIPLRPLVTSRGYTQLERRTNAINPTGYQSRAQ